MCVTAAQSEAWRASTAASRLQSPVSAAVRLRSQPVSTVECAVAVQPYYGQVILIDISDKQKLLNTILHGLNNIVTNKILIDIINEFMTLTKRFC